MMGFENIRDDKIRVQFQSLEARMQVYHLPDICMDQLQMIAEKVVKLERANFGLRQTVSNNNRNRERQFIDKHFFE